MRPAGFSWILIALAGCASAATEGDAGAPADGGESDAALSRECLVIEEGDNADFPIGNATRNFTLVVPDGYDDSRSWPIVFAWHWLGGDDSTMVSDTGLGALAEQEGFFVVAPESRHLKYEWDVFDTAPDDNPDIVVFDRLLECMRGLYRIDPDRVYSVGFSAGGLMTAYLGMYRAPVLAANAVVSGGLLISWVPPEAHAPWLVAWGGTGDEVLGVNFNDKALALIDDLVTAGDLVMACDHGQGHTWPPGTQNYVWRFFADHPRGAADPYHGVVPSDFPAYCDLAN
jgi:poly(3-hydroxybutyrate) depolymerase